MKSVDILIAALILVLMCICGNASEAPPPDSARYQLIFQATWSKATYPLNLPPHPHFSGLIGATHSPTVHLWKEGKRATPGIKNMAEIGSKSPLLSEIDSLIRQRSACTTICGGGINPSPSAVTVTFMISQDCPVVSVVSMITPSPINQQFIPIKTTTAVNINSLVS